MHGLVKGIRSDLEVPIVIKIYNSSNNDCTRLITRLFYWSKGALNKTESLSTENNMMKVVLSTAELPIS